MEIGEAEGHLLAAVALQEKDVMLYTMLADLRIAAGQPAEAERYLDQMVALAPAMAGATREHCFGEAAVYYGMLAQLGRRGAAAKQRKAEAEARQWGA